MLVHGFCDVTPSWICHHIFNDTTILGYSLGNTFLTNIFIIINSILLLNIFKTSPYLIIFAIPLLNNFLTLLFLCYISLLNKSIIQKPFNWLVIYILLAFIFTNYTTTNGTFWLLSSLPLFFYIFYKLTQTKKPIVKILFLNLFNVGFRVPALICLEFFLILLISTLLFISKDILLPYFIDASNYIKGNLYAFGNDFPDDNIHLPI